MFQAKFEPREEWPSWIRSPLDRIGIGRYESIDTILPKIKALGFEIFNMGEDRGLLGLGDPVFYAAVIDPNDDDSIRGEYWSATDFAEALAWATAAVLNDREMRARQLEERLLSTEPDDYTLTEFGQSRSTARALMIKLPSDSPTQEFAAHVIVEDEVVARVSTPFLRGTSKWSDEHETSFRATIRNLANSCSLRGRSGKVRLVMNPGAPDQFEEIVERKSDS